METNSSTVDAVIGIVVATLGIEERAGTFTSQTALLGAVPELDSLAVVEIANALEERFDFRIDDADFTADVFETIASLATFVDESRAN